MHAILSWLYVIAAVVLLFGASVFVHEFGHFLAARRLGLKVEGFSIGFGPKLFGWKRGGVQYAWRLIPAGGFVALPQLMGSEAIEGKTESNEPLPPVSPRAKILVALAGPAMNALFAFLIAVCIYFLGLPMLVNPAIIGGVPPGSTAGKLGIRAGDRIVAVNGKPVKTWDEVQTTAAMAPTNMLPVVIEHDGARTTYMLPTKINTNLGVKLLDLEPSEHPVIREVLPGSAAERDGLREGDQVIAFNGAPIAGDQQLVELIKKRPGQPSQMQIQRGQRRLSLTVTPRMDPATKAGVLGVAIGPNTTNVYEVQRPGPPPWNQVAQVWQQTVGTIGALFHSKRTGVSVKDLSGPPGILAMLAIELKTDFRLALKFMVLLNINLAILNLLPVPVLDGGHIAMAVIEKLRGRPLNPRIQEYATMLFAMLLIGFMLYVSFNDISRRFQLFRTMLNERGRIESNSEK